MRKLLRWSGLVVGTVLLFAAGWRAREQFTMDWRLDSGGKVVRVQRVMTCTWTGGD